MSVLKQLGNHPKLVWCIQFGVSLFQIAIFVLNTNTKFVYIYDLLEMSEPIVRIVDLHKGLFAAITNIAGTVSLLKHTSLIIKINLVSDKMVVTADRLKFNRIKFIFNSLVMLTSITYSLFVAHKSGWSIMSYVILESLNYIYFILILFSIFSIEHALKDNIIDINDSIRRKLLLNFCPRFIARSLEFDKYMVRKDNMVTYLETLRYITRRYETVSDMFDAFNREFKLILVLSLIYVTMDILWGLTMIIHFSTKSNEYIYPIVILSLLTLILCGECSAAAWLGEEIETEGYQTIRLCYSLLNKLSKSAARQYDQEIEKQLNLLLDQSKSRKFSLHAGGFFQLNWGILGSIATNITAYAIVIIQFLFKK